MISLLAKDQPKREYDPPTQADRERKQRIVIIDFWIGEGFNNYRIIRGTRNSGQVIESGPMPDLTDSREDRALRGKWMDEKVESARQIAKSEKMLLSGKHINEDYR